jgi:hypothetical protein
MKNPACAAGFLLCKWHDADDGCGRDGPCVDDCQLGRLLSLSDSHENFVIGSVMR